jgi:hypothetical protein
MENSSESGEQGDRNRWNYFRRPTARITAVVFAMFLLFAAILPANELIAIAVLIGAIAIVVFLLRWIGSRIDWNWSTITIAHVIGLIAAMAIRGCIDQ